MDKVFAGLSAEEDAYTHPLGATFVYGCPIKFTSPIGKPTGNRLVIRQDWELRHKNDFDTGTGKLMLYGRYGVIPYGS